MVLCIFFLDKVLFEQVLNSYWFLQIYLFIPQPPISKSRYVEELKVLKEIAFSIYNDIHFHFEKLDPNTLVLCQHKIKLIHLKRVLRMIFWWFLYWPLFKLCFTLDTPHPLQNTPLPLSRSTSRLLQIFCIALS